VTVRERLPEAPNITVSAPELPSVRQLAIVVSEDSMPCLFLIIVLAFPRIVLLVLFFVSDYLTRAYSNLLLPVVGFIFVPLTTLAYAWMVNNHMPLEGANLLILVLAVVLDLGGLGGGEYHRRRR
jgi:hypothetical protein